MNFIGIFSLMTLFAIMFPVTGNSIGLSKIQRLIYDQQYSAFRECQAAGIQMQEAMMANETIKGMPFRKITEKDVSFLLFTRTKFGIYRISIADDMNETFTESGFNKSKDTVLYVHPAMETWYQGGMAFVSTILSRRDVNLIITDWDSYAFTSLMYSRNVTTPILGRIVGKFVQKLINFGTDSIKIHLIGFSAGGQAVGLASKIITPKVGRITAYDPQGSCFNFLPPDRRLSKEDADYVEIVHCTVGPHGMPLNITGHSTFYMNGGLVQPYCLFLPIRKLVDCSHALCGLYLYLSLLEKSPLKGYKCHSYEDYLSNQCDFNNTVALTYDVSTNVIGKYYVNTIT